MEEPGILKPDATASAAAAPSSGARTLLVVFLASIAVLALGVAGREISKTDEHRYLAVAREFAVTGDWFVCRLNGATYTHKPPGFFWLAAAANALGLSWTLASMLPGVLGGAVSAALVFDLAHRFWGRLAAWTAALVLLTSEEYYFLATRGNLDGFLSLWTTLAAYAFVRATTSDAAGARTRWTVVGFLATGCGVMVKGPAAIAIPGAAALVALIWDDSWSRTPWWRWVLGSAALAFAVEPGVLSPGASKALFAARLAAFVVLTGIWRSRWSALATWRWALAPLVFLPGLAWAVAAARQAPEGWDYVHALAFGQGVEHAAGQVDKLEPWWFYAKAFPLGLMPWTFLLPAAVWAWSRFRAPERRAADRFAMAWVVAPLVVMSISLAKRDLYLVPVYPAAALLISRIAPTLAADASRLTASAVRWGLRGLAVVGIVGGAALLLLGAVTAVGRGELAGRVWTGWDAARGALPTWCAAGGVAAGIALVVAGVTLWRARAFRAVARGVLVLCAGLLAAIVCVYIPFNNALYARRPFLETVRGRIGDAPLFDLGGTDFAANWICERSVVATVRPADALSLLRATTGPVYFVLERSRLPSKGLPEGTRVIIDDPRTNDAALVLIGRE
ncbi:MAG: glycosyltransferase family 39 protein [Planctomycetes bacterium]|nr:glycosyltransferase family 39 protein [Planctomycetota bacterium]